MDRHLERCATCLISCHSFLIILFSPGQFQRSVLLVSPIASPTELHIPYLTADIVKMIDSQPDLAPLIRRVRGGYLKIQGTWMPYEVSLSSHPSSGTTLIETRRLLCAYRDGESRRGRTMG